MHSVGVSNVYAPTTTEVLPPLRAYGRAQAPAVAQFYGDVSCRPGSNRAKVYTLGRVDRFRVSNYAYARLWRITDPHVKRWVDISTHSVPPR